MMGKERKNKVFSTSHPFPEKKKVETPLQPQIQKATHIHTDTVTTNENPLGRSIMSDFQLSTVRRVLIEMQTNKQRRAFNY